MFAFPDPLADERDEDLLVIEAMERYGGSFVKALGTAARHADSSNLLIIKKSWPFYWDEYKRVALKK